MTTTLLFGNRFYLKLSLHCPKMNEKSMSEGKKKHDFGGERDIKSCYHVAARHVKLWSLSANFLVENVSLQSSNCNILGLKATVAFFANEAVLLFRCHHRRPRRCWSFTYVTVLRYVLGHLRECMKIVRKSL